MHKFTIPSGGLPYDHANFIENALHHFESCFSRKAAFRWFVTIAIGLMLRSDRLGITSVIRDLALNPDCYDSMLHFFRASSWSLGDICERLFSAVRKAPAWHWNRCLSSGFTVTGSGLNVPSGN